MKDAPVTAALDLWSLGHSASQIAQMLGFPNRRHVERIIAHARSIKDPRAVLHKASNNRLIGAPGHHARKVIKREKVGGIEVVPALPQKTHCPRGHLKVPENMRGANCRQCEKILRRLRYERDRG